MDIYELLASHRSIRRYLPDPVPHELIDKILQAALQGASSSGNMQALSVIVTTDQALKQQLYPLHFHQDMVLEAPVVMTFCSDFHRMRLWLAQRAAADNFDNLMSFLIGAIDALIVAQNAVLAAESEGLGICYMGTTLANCQAIADLLRLPDNVVPVAGFVLGYPAERPARRDRLPLAGIVHRETYQDYSPVQVTDIYRERETAGWQRYMADAELCQRVLASGARNLAQIYTTVKYTRASHLEYSRTVEACLRDKDFLAG